ncbi:hypothetical protein K438DRAFT_1628156 [Mycena galopus ATCC 62051]|nr:hypothetical protein K438DRAFT_1628156 [Mycena galopus ATCC 62051]
MEDGGVSQAPAHRSKSFIKLNDGRRLELGDTIFEWDRTSVSRANLDAKNVVVKWSWSAKNSTPEGDIVKIATDLVNKCHSDSWVLSHLPKILHYEEEEVGRNSLHEHPYLYEQFGDNHELEALRIVVQEELCPITELTTAEELGEAVHGIFKCYRWLYERPRIMHRDISVDNLMFRRIDGKIFGVLNDFDLSVVLSDSPSTSEQRTGTAPYMALDLLMPGLPPPHLYRFDLESLFYVMVVVSCSYEDGAEIENPPFDEWEHLGTAKLWDQKTIFFCNLVPPPTPGFVGFNNLNQSLAMLFVNGFRARRSHELRASLGRGLATDFDDRTLGGHVTFDTFERILEENLPPAT